MIINPFQFGLPSDPMNDEFSGSSLDAKWSRLNQGASTAVVGSGTLTIAIASGTQNIRGVLQPAPSGNCVFETKLNSNASGACILFYNSGSGKLQGSTHTFPGNLVYPQRWPDVTGNGTNGTPVALTCPGYLRLSIVGTNIVQHISSDGTNWTQIYSYPLASHMITITHVGLCISGSNAQSAVFDYFRRIS